MHTNHTGYTLIELCIILAILSIFSFMLIPAFSYPLMRAERLMVMSRLRMAIALAKQQAFADQAIITLCPSLDGRTCKTMDQSHWDQGFIIIRKAHPTQGSYGTLLIRTFASIHFGKLTFNASGGLLQFTPNGYTYNPGTFTYCPKNGNPIEASALIINRGGRTYEAVQRNKQGILLKEIGTAQVEPLSCR